MRSVWTGPPALASYTQTGLDTCPASLMVLVNITTKMYQRFIVIIRLVIFTKRLVDHLKSVILKKLQTQSWSFIKPTIKDTDLSIEMIQCFHSLKLLNLSNIFDYSLTVGGDLLSLNGAYQPSLDLGDFCLELTFNWALKTFQRMALICDPCLKVRHKFMAILNSVHLAAIRTERRIRFHCFSAFS